MPAFHDSQNRKWSLEITVFALRKIKGELGIDLLTNSNVMELIASDVSQLVDIIEILTRDQPGRKDISIEDFARGFSGDVLEQAADAFVEALIESFPSARRAATRAAWNKLREMQAREGSHLLSLVESPAMEAKFQAALSQIEQQMLSSLTPGASSKSGPESRASTETT